MVSFCFEHVIDFLKNARRWFPFFQSYFTLSAIGLLLLNWAFTRLDQTEFSIGFYGLDRDFIGFDSVLLGFGGFLLCFTMFYYVSQGSTMVLLGFRGYYWA